MNYIGNISHQQGGRGGSLGVNKLPYLFSHCMSTKCRKKTTLEPLRLPNEKWIEGEEDKDTNTRNTRPEKLDNPGSLGVFTRIKELTSAPGALSPLSAPSALETVRLPGRLTTSLAGVQDFAIPCDASGERASRTVVPLQKESNPANRVHQQDENQEVRPGGKIEIPRREITKELIGCQPKEPPAVACDADDSWCKPYYFVNADNLVTRLSLLVKWVREALRPSSREDLIPVQQLFEEYQLYCRARGGLCESSRFNDSPTFSKKLKQVLDSLGVPNSTIKSSQDVRSVAGVRRHGEWKRRNEMSAGLVDRGEVAGHGAGKGA